MHGICSQMARDSRIIFLKKEAFLTMHLFRVSRFHEAPAMIGLKMFQTMYKPTLVNIVYSLMPSISKQKTITAVVFVNGDVFLNSERIMHLVEFQIFMLHHFLKWTYFRKIWWHLLFYGNGNIACMNTITQLMISCVLHSHQFATSIF